MRLPSAVLVTVILGACVSASVSQTSSHVAFQRCALQEKDWTISASPPEDRNDLLLRTLNGATTAKFLTNEWHSQYEAWFSPASDEVRTREGDLLVCRYTRPKDSCITPIATFRRTAQGWEALYHGEAVCTQD